MTAPKNPERLIAYQKARIARLDTRIGVLMAQRVTEEETLATLIQRVHPSSPPTKPMSNPTVEGGGQPFRGEQKVVLEKRDPQTGKLDFTGEQPPTGENLTFDDVWTLYARTNPKEWDGSWETLLAWLNSKGWVVRVKTW